MRKKKSLPEPYAEPTKDARFAGTFEVMIPAEGRVRPHRVPQQFESKDSAEAWIHSQEGKKIIAEFLSGNTK